MYNGARLSVFLATFTGAAAAGFSVSAGTMSPSALTIKDRLLVLLEDLETCETTRVANAALFAMVDAKDMFIGE